MKINNSHGISIVETLIALSILVIVALTSSQILTTTNVLRKKEETKATIDQVHVLQIQRARRSQILKYSDPPTFTVERLSANQKFCFDGSRSGFGGTDTGGCNVKATSGIPNAADWSDSEVLSGFDNTAGFKMFGESNVFGTEVRWRGNCPSGDRCTSIDVRITTSVNVGAALQGKLEPRVTILTFPAQFFADQKAISFTCTTIGNKIATTVDNGSNRARCNAFAAGNEVSCTTEYPMHIFGDIVGISALPTCIVPANVDCSAGANRGYRRIAFNTKDCRNR